MKIYAYIATEDSELVSSNDLWEYHKRFPGQKNDRVFVYTHEINGDPGLTDRDLQLIGQGLFFQNDWYADDTISYVTWEA